MSQNVSGDQEMSRTDESLKEGEPLEFDVEQGTTGPKAASVKRLKLAKD